MTCTDLVNRILQLRVEASQRNTYFVGTIHSFTIIPQTDILVFIYFMAQHLILNWTSLLILFLLL